MKAAPVRPPSPAALAVVGWLLPGGGYLLLCRYRQFAFFLLLVSAATAAGILLRGGNLWPAPGEVQGLDGLAAAMARGGALAKALAGGPYLLARLFGYSQTYLAGCLHEYGNVLLTVAGLLNLMALADAWGLKGSGARMTHLAFTVLLALLIAAAMALVGDRAGRERLYLGIYWFCSAMACVVAGAWFMHWVHG